MKIQTVYFDEVEVNEDKIITFPFGLPGFQNERQFIVMDIPENPMFSVLQSVTNPDLAFIISSPYVIEHNYEFDLDETTVQQLAITSVEDVSVFSIVTMKETFEQSTINLQAPVIVNVKNNMGKQVVLNESRYHTKHPITSTKESEEKTDARFNKENR
ncbi:flagellar assembly protein FliW [Salirhabdus salicampi]|uniref:flagellar assembly protein FliW n=1 Tax=Salirhabdus salicampi TaxID=476102 RepID=UPI0020C4E760|nr:flagellar assembly protein FliW [Salirhabdus salicampi]MCP8617600.1 flagellar assembly protein FliW [Salirhabdus salicampi]